jgi:putative transposase
MPRRARRLLWTEGACYHVLNRGHARETLFHDSDDHRAFLSILDRYRVRFGLRVYHYCLMTNHFHLVVQFPRAAGLSRVIAGLGVAYWHHYRRRHGLVGHLFQGRFKSPAVDGDQYLLSCGRYVERNPLAAGLCAAPWEYPWSSCRAYALGEANPLLSPNGWYQELSPEPARRQVLWRDFLTRGDPKEAIVRCGDWVIGDDAFRRELHQPKARPVPRSRGRPREVIAGTFVSEEIGVAGLA